MENFILYIVKSGLSLMLLYLIYWIFMRKETYFTLNRLYLLSSAVFSLLLPLISFPIEVQPTGQYSVLLDGITITSDGISNTFTQNLSLFQVLFVVYITGVVLFSVRLFLQLLHILKITTSFGFSTADGLKLVVTDKNYTPFSFFNLIFLNKEVSKADAKKIFTHETIHVKQWHSADVILLEILTIFQWFNPIIWLYRYSLREIHEYLADEGALAHGIEKKEYQQLLLAICMGSQINELSNNFNKSLIKKRIIMMTKMKSGVIARMKPAIAIPAMALLLFVFACGNKADKKAENKNNDTVTTIVTSNPVDPNDTVVFEVVDMPPEYIGGEKALVDFLGKNTKYPENAKNNNITGKVYVSFVIDENGMVTNPKIERGVNEELDAEAIRVVKSMPKWKAGQQNGKTVKVRMTLPFSFQLK